ncbi:MAG: hypothetical protein Q7J30_02910, partial [Candidatus Azambacteria bacterium]|nr:hypothetical protein [Candidatus Azambacteria bacterium]
VLWQNANMHSYQKTIDYLNKCVENDMLSHAYIFYGPDEDSKRETVFWFANKILKNENSKFHPDLLAVKSELNEDISINLVRQVKNFLTLRPYSNNHKVVIIEMAEKLNFHAQNALLKTFEEAPHYAVIILGVKTLSSISDTVVSRGIKLPFWRIQSEALPPDKTAQNICEDLFKTEFSNKYKCVEKIGSCAALEFFRTWLNFLRIKFMDKPTQELSRLLVKSQNIYFKLNETNINPKLAYDELILSLWKI